MVHSSCDPDDAAGSEGFGGADEGSEIAGILNSRCNDQERGLPCK